MVVYGQNPIPGISHLNFPPKYEFREITSTSLWNPGNLGNHQKKVTPRPRRQSSSRGENDKFYAAFISGG